MSDPGRPEGLKQGGAQIVPLVEGTGRRQLHLGCAETEEDWVTITFFSAAPGQLAKRTPTGATITCVLGDHEKTVADIALDKDQLRALFSEIGKLLHT